MNKVTPEMRSAWVDWDAPGQFSESMSFARFNGMLQAAFFAGWIAHRNACAQPENDTGLTSFKDTLS